MIISVLNQSSVADGDVQRALRAINRQIARDFEPCWGLGARLRLARTTRTGKPAKGANAVLHVLDEVNNSYHIDTTGTPCGFVFVNQRLLTAKHVPWLDWTVALSHETLELIADPQVNTLIQGPHPDAGHVVFYYREICDPVQQDCYVIDGVRVSSFVLPHYYNSVWDPTDPESIYVAPGGRNDFLSTRLKPFGWNTGGTVGFWDPRAGKAGDYVVYPRYEPGHLVRKVRTFKGKWSRLARYRRTRRGRKRAR